MRTLLRGPHGRGWRRRRASVRARPCSPARAGTPARGTCRAVREGHAARGIRGGGRGRARGGLAVELVDGALPHAGLLFVLLGMSVRVRIERGNETKSAHQSIIRRLALLAPHAALLVSPRDTSLARQHAIDRHALDLAPPAPASPRCAETEGSVEVLRARPRQDRRGPPDRLATRAAGGGAGRREGPGGGGTQTHRWHAGVVRFAPWVWPAGLACGAARAGCCWCATGGGAGALAGSEAGGGACPKGCSWTGVGPGDGGAKPDNDECGGALIVG